MSHERPNIILILTDQQRGDCIGLDPNAPAVLQTPNIDHLGHRGTMFTRGYSECPSCVPARRALMTGTAPAANGMVGYRNGVAWNPSHTLAGELTRAGYQTELIGKLHLGPPTHKRFGFEHMQLANSTRGENNDYIDWLRTQGRHEQAPGVAHGIDGNGWVGRPHHLPEEQMHTFWCVDRAMDFLNKRDPTVPFFLNLSLIDPHPPLTPPAFYYDRYIHRDLPAPVVGDWAKRFEQPQRGTAPASSHVTMDEHAMRCCRAAYYGMINFIDDQIGRLMAFGGVPHNTVVVFTSDHGEMLGDHNLFRKTFAYEASARVPFLIAGPASTGLVKEQRCASPVGWQDIMPTLLDIAGAPIPETCTGRSLLPMLRGEAQGVREVLHGEHAGCYNYDDGVHFLTDGHEKYIWYSQTGEEQLFNLDDDPNELHNRATPAAPGPAGDEAVRPWRRRLVEVLQDRPEGFVSDGDLVPGRPHDALLPDYDPNRFYPYL